MNEGTESRRIKRKSRSADQQTPFEFLKMQASKGNREVASKGGTTDQEKDVAKDKKGSLYLFKQEYEIYKTLGEGS